MRVLILAAGYATRLYPLTRTCPKALLPAGEGVLLDYILAKVVELPNLQNLTLISNHRFAPAFQSYAGQLQQQGFPFALEIIDDGTTREETKLGAIGDLDFYLRREGVSEDCLILASDNLFTYSLKEAYSVFQSREADLVLGQEIESYEDLRRFAVAVCNPEGRVLQLVEKPKHPPSRMAVYASYFYRAESLARVKQYLQEGGNPDSPGHFPAWLCQQTPVYLHAFEGLSLDIGTLESYREVDAMIRANSCPHWKDRL